MARFLNSKRILFWGIKAPEKFSENNSQFTIILVKILDIFSETTMEKVLYLRNVLTIFHVSYVDFWQR